MRSRSVKWSCGAFAALATSTFAVAGGTDTGPTEQILYNLTGVEYLGGIPEIIATLEISANARLVELKWENVVLETFDNVGVPNWGSEAVLGVSGVNTAGETHSELFLPFPNANSGGIFGPVDGSLDLLFADMFSDQSGHIMISAGSTWDDNTGLPAGEYLDGQLVLIYAPIPAPGAIALLGLAGLATRRRRR